jgi:hypothetical protein
MWYYLKRLLSFFIKHKATKMQTYTPIEPTVQAEIVASFTLVTSVTLADGSLVTTTTVPAVGDYAVQATDGTISFVPKAEFESKFKPV